MRTLAILHPFPSAINAILVAAIAIVAGGTAGTALGLASAMLLVQFSIGVANDVADIARDRLSKPHKPLVRGDLDRGRAAIIAVLLGAGGLAGAALQGGAAVVLLAAIYGAGLAYDAGLKGLGLGWVAYAVAFPLLPAYAWVGASGALPPRYESLLPIAMLAGPTLALANGLVDYDRDRAAGARTVVVRIGRRTAWVVMVAGLAFVHGTAAVTVGRTLPDSVPLAMVVAGALALLGAGLSASDSAIHRERGWRIQTLAIALLATAWFLAATGSERSALR